MTTQAYRWQKWLAITTFMLATATVLMAGFTAWSACQTKRMADQTSRIVELTQQDLESNLLQARFQYLKGRLDEHKYMYIDYLNTLLYDIDSTVALLGNKESCNRLGEYQLFCEKYYEYGKAYLEVESLCGQVLKDLENNDLPSARKNLQQLEAGLHDLTQLYWGTIGARFK